MIRTLKGPQLALDVCMALLLLLASLPWIGSSLLIEVLCLLAISAGVAIRRLSPMLALAVAWIGAILQMLAGSSPTFGDIGILLVLYAVGRYGTRKQRRLGLASAVAGAIVATIYLVYLQPLAVTGISNGGVSSLFESTFTFVASLAVLALAWTTGLVARLVAQNNAQRASEAQERYRRELSERAVIVEQERNQIARDMHDVVAHSLAVVIAQADGARYAAATNPGAATEALGTIAASARSSLGEVRMLLTALRHRQGEGPQPSLLDLDALFDQLRAAGLDVRVVTSGVPLPLGSGQEIAAYRIVQEGLTNALRHGQAGEIVWVRLDWWGGGLAVMIDNALLHGAALPSGSGGHGLPGMRERATLAGGTFASGTVDGARYRVAAMIPALATSGGQNHA